MFSSGSISIFPVTTFLKSCSAYHMITCSQSTMIFPSKGLCYQARIFRIQVFNQQFKSHLKRLIFLSISTMNYKFSGILKSISYVSYLTHRSIHGMFHLGLCGSFIYFHMVSFFVNSYFQFIFISGLGE